MLDNDELIATRKLNGIDDGMYGDKDIKEYKINMTKEQSIELLKNSLSKFEIRGEQLYLLKIAIENILSELEQKDKQIQELEEENQKVLDLIFEYGQIDGGHHKMWVIDQIVRILTKDKYNEWIKNYVYDEETGDTYDWDKGIAP